MNRRVDHLPTGFQGPVRSWSGIVPAAERTPRLPRARAGLAADELGCGENQRALRVLTAFLAAHPDSPGACQQTTLILHRLGLLAQAKRMGRHAVSLLEARALDHEAAAMNKILATI